MLCTAVLALILLFLEAFYLMLLGGEGIFNTVVRGPGKVILQTMPISKVAELLTPFFSNKK